MGWYFLFFFISGFCSLLYEIIWLRLGMAQFGVTSALVSIVISMFMAGLGLGSWGGGRLLHRYGNRIGFSALRIYAMTELLIGLSAIMVPRQLQWGRTLLEHTSLSSSAAYYFFSGIWIALTLVPWCACMGATIPVAMQAIRTDYRKEADRSFSFLYLANVLGAAAGTTLPLLLIELYGFHGTLKIGAALNIFLACSAMGFSLRKPAELPLPMERPASRPSSAARMPAASSGVLFLLFGTGLTSMGMEVVWIRQFTPYLGTVVYAFASILGLYLVFTFLGSHFYRSWSRNHTHEANYDGRLIWLLLGFFALFPLITADPQFKMSHFLRLLIGICPFSAVLGFVTPMLVDRWSGGDPDLAGSAYAVNVGGCIIGPLLSGFILLPLISERWVLSVLALPWIVIGLYREWTSERPAAQGGKLHPKAISGFVATLALIIVFVSRGYEDRFPHHVVLRDNTATVIATGEGMRKQLLVNGVGITSLMPVTKMMAHLPLAFLDHAPQNTLTICFGMGTTYRSLLSWGIPSTAVELAPSVPRVFGYFHPDGPELLRSPLSHLVIDDGRRYLERTAARYDVITIDPPPPVEAAGSSMLYSKEFYSIVTQHLQPGGILQQWLPYGDAAVRASVARAIKESFPYVRLFQYGPDGGFHFLASNRPIPNRNSAQLAQNLPSKAAIDMVEWSPGKTPAQVFAEIIGQETSIDQFIAQDPRAPAMQDNRPVNEYYVLRRALP
jgi:spermidine synthase